MGQRVQHGDANAIVMLQGPSDEVGADEAGPSRNYNFSHVLSNHAVDNFLMLTDACRLNMDGRRESRMGRTLYS